MNHEEIVGLIHYVCEHNDKLEYESDFGQYYFMKYIMGVGNYYPL